MSPSLFSKDPFTSVLTATALKTKISGITFNGKICCSWFDDYLYVNMMDLFSFRKNAAMNEDGNKIFNKTFWKIILVVTLSLFYFILNKHNSWSPYSYYSLFLPPHFFNLHDDCNTINIATTFYPSSKNISKLVWIPSHQSQKIIIVHKKISKSIVDLETRRNPWFLSLKIPPLSSRKTTYSLPRRKFPFIIIITTTTFAYLYHGAINWCFLSLVIFFCY